MKKVKTRRIPANVQWLLQLQLQWKERRNSRISDGRIELEVVRVGLFFNRKEVPGQSQRWLFYLFLLFLCDVRVRRRRLTSGSTTAKDHVFIG